MPDASVSKRLQKTIIAYSALGLLFVSAAVALVGILPLANKLREAQQRNLLVDLQRQTVAVEQFLSRARGSAALAANRTKTREKLDAYNRGELPLADFSAAIAPLMRDPMVFSTNIAGVALFDVQSNLVAGAGLDIPREHWSWPDPSSRESTILGPLRLTNETFLVISGTIFGDTVNRSGTVMVLYRTRPLQSIVTDYRGLGRSGETILGSRLNKNLPVFFPLRQIKPGVGPDSNRTTAIMSGLQRALEKRSDLFEPEAPLDDSLIMAYGPVKGTDWGIVVSMSKAELFSAMNRNLAIVGSVIALLILLGTGGMIFLLRPLAGRVILHTDELESQIYEKTAALNTELAERKRAENSLRNSEALYHSLVDTLPISILRKDLRGRVTYGNRGYCERMGKPFEELRGKTDYELFPKDLADKYLNDDEKVVRTGEMFEDIEEHRSGDGTRKTYVHVLKAPVRDASSQIVGTQVIFWDVTARKLAEEALAKAADELARSNQELEHFAYVASHDLQDPLRMVTSYTQLIAKRYDDKLDSDAREFMHFAVDGATRMQKLIQGLLEYSRVGTKGKPFENVSCQQALDHALANLKIALEETGATVTHDPLPTFLGDPIQFTQLLQNLIGNALKFRGPNVPRIHIGAERRPRAEAATLGGPPYEWVLHIRDNGIGIEPQYFERIFVIFQRLHTQDQYPGTGIGLAICKKIVERHGGRIWLESKAGQGTTFHIALPAMD